MARLTGNAVNALPVAEVIVAAAATAVDVAVAADSGDGTLTLSSAAIDVLRSNDELRIGSCIVKYGTDDVGDDPNSVAADVVAAAAADDDDDAADANGLANNWLYSWKNFELWKYSGMYLLYSNGIKCVLPLLMLLQVRGDAVLRHKVFTAAATTTGE